MKTYFIGLGGCGLQTVAALSKRLSKEQNYSNDYAFTYIDTDMYTKDRINSDEIIIQAADFVDMGPTVPLAIYNGAKDTDHPTANTKRLLEWVITQQYGHMVLPYKPLSDGATAQRNVGRFGIYNMYEAVERELSAKIARFNELQPDDNGRRDVDIWVIASSCGGTGSSMIMDVLYMINRIGNPVAVGEPNVKLVLYMPQTFVGLNKENANHKLNGYACMEEINFFRSNYEAGRKKSFEPYAVRPTRKGEQIFDFPLYQFLIPVCAENNFGSKMKVEQFYPTVAEMIYYLNTGNGRAFVKSNLSNILAQLLQRPENREGVTSQMIGYGFRAIKKANKELKEYLTRRALYEVINYGLLNQARPSDFDQLKVEFAHNAILRKLVSLDEKVRENEITYQYKNTVDADSIEMLVQAEFNKFTHDPNNVSASVMQAIDLKINRKYNSEEDFEGIFNDTYTLITNEIDKRLNEFILMYGLSQAYDLINFVDDFYLEPLCRYIVNTLQPRAIAAVNSAKAICETYEKGGILLSLKKAEMSQSIKQYKAAVSRAVSLKLAVQIIKKLTETPTGYLEKLRKGDNLNFTGIRNLQKALEIDCTEFKDKYAELAKEFRATADDVMTVYVPSLAELAVGENNTDWAENNTFDQLYQESILEQQVIEVGVEKKNVPVRTSQNSRGLKDIMGRIDLNGNLFIKIIEDKPINLPGNKTTQLIAKIKEVINVIVNATGTPAYDWINLSLSDAIMNPAYLPSTFKRPEDLFNSFRDVNRVPVFFPLRGDVQMPSSMRLMFVGDNEEFAMSLGYNPQSDEQQFIHDSSMADRFMVMRMPAGFEFDMYKYYPGYETFYSSEAYNSKVRNQYYGCYIHRAFNEYGLTISQLADDSSSAEENVSDQLAKKRIESLVKCLYYQEVVNILWSTNKRAYNNLFGFSTNNPIVDTSNLSPALLALLGGGNSNIGNGKPAPFISFNFDATKFSISIQMRDVTFNPSTSYLEVNSKDVQNFEFDQAHSQQCKAFIEQLLTMPESLFKVVDYLDQRFDLKNEMLHQALKDVHQEALQRFLAPEDENLKPTFAFCYSFWLGNNATDDKVFIEAIAHAMSAL